MKRDMVIAFITGCICMAILLGTSHSPIVVRFVSADDVKKFPTISASRSRASKVDQARLQNLASQLRAPMDSDAARPAVLAGPTGDSE